MATDRLHSELEFHDRQAVLRAESFRRLPEKLSFTDDDYLDHETWIRPAFALLGDVAGRSVLDFGCGHGMAAVVLARRAARVTACDLSAGYLAEARARAEVNGVALDLVQADGERLPFADQAFDRIWGNAVLHHLDLRVAGPELFRVLKPGGIAVFCEPWGGNPLLQCARAWLPYPGKQRTRDERPLGPADVHILQATFPDLTLQGFQLLAMLRRVLRPGAVTRACTRWDARLLRCLPGLQRMCRYMVIRLRRA